MTVTSRYDIQALVDFPVHFKQVVAWADMDAFGHVNNVIYYRYIENARLEYYRQIGWDLKQTLTVILSSQCRYIRPVIYPDTLYIGARVVKIGNTSFTMEYVLYSQSQKAVVATSDAVMVTLNSQHQKISIPQQMRQLLEDKEAEVRHLR